MSIIQAAALLGALVASVAAHGHVQGIVVDGTYYEGYNPSFQYMSLPPAVIGWSCPECLDNGFVAPDAYGGNNITCHKDATPGQAHATVAAGGTVELQWTAWPSSHHGPVIDYLAKCSGDCEKVDKTTLEFFKIDQGGLVDDTTVPGNWATDQLIAANNSWTVKIPSSIAPGNYVLRHEIIALHSAGTTNGAQNYPQCINIEVTGSGTDSPSGVLGTALYKETDPGILINIYSSLSTYDIPGPTLYSGAVSVSQSAISTAATASTSSVTSATSAAISSSAVVSPTKSSSAASSAVVSTIAVSSTPVSSVATAVTSSSPSYGEATGYVTSDITTVATTEVVVTVTPISSSNIAPIASAIANLTAIPSGLLTSILPTAIPTGSDNSSGTLPSTTLPSGMTFKELLEWVDYIIRAFFSEEKRKHARDLSPTGAQKRQFNFSNIPSGGFSAPSGFVPSGVAAIGTAQHHHSHRPYGTGHGFGTGTHAVPVETGAPFATAGHAVASAGGAPFAIHSGGSFSMPSGGFAHPTGTHSHPSGGFSFGTGRPTGRPTMRDPTLEGSFSANPSPTP